MNSATELDQQRHELALGAGLLGGSYSIEEAELLAEQRNLRWDKVKFWAGLNNKKAEK